MPNIAVSDTELVFLFGYIEAQTVAHNKEVSAGAGAHGKSAKASTEQPQSNR